MKKIVFFDTETTGLVLPMRASYQPRIIEICAIATDDKLRIKKVYSQTINPECQIPDFITKITGLKQADVANSPTLAQEYKSIKKIFKNADRVVAHNLMFDYMMFANEMVRIEKPMPIMEGTDLFCTCEQSFHIMGFRLKLKELYHIATGEPEIPGAHRAENDVRAMIKCYKYLINEVE